jgi:thioredoxin 1
MSNAMELTNANFRSTVDSGVTLVDFWAEWCGPCRMMAPVLDELSAQYAGKVTIGKINVDNEGELAQEFGVSSIPTLIVFKDGKEVNRYVGVTSKTELARALDAAAG